MVTMRDKMLSFEMSEKQATLLGATYYAMKYVCTHVNGFKINEDTPDDHTVVFKQALRELMDHQDEYEALGTKFLCLLELRNTTEYC